MVLAVGIRDFAYVPPALATISPELMSHSSEVAEPSRFAGRDVTVLGAGASAIDLAMLLHEAGASTRLVARAPRLEFHSGDQGRRGLLSRLRLTDLGMVRGGGTWWSRKRPVYLRTCPNRRGWDVVRRMLGPAAGKGVRERVEGKVTLLVDRRIAGVNVRNHRLSIDLEGEGGTANIETDHLIAATGYRPDVSRLSFLSPSLMQRISLERGDARTGTPLPVVSAGPLFRRSGGSQPLRTCAALRLRRTLRRQGLGEEAVLRRRSSHRWSGDSLAATGLRCRAHVVAWLQVRRFRVHERPLPRLN